MPLPCKGLVGRRRISRSCSVSAVRVFDGRIGNDGGSTRNTRTETGTGMGQDQFL